MELRFGLIFFLVVQLITISSSSSVAMSNLNPAINQARAANDSLNSLKEASKEPPPIDIGVALTEDRLRSLPPNETSSGILEDIQSVPSKISSSFWNIGCHLGVSSCKNETVSGTPSTPVNTTTVLPPVNTTSPAP